MDHSHRDIIRHLIPTVIWARNCPPTHRCYIWRLGGLRNCLNGHYSWRTRELLVCSEITVSILRSVKLIHAVCKVCSSFVVRLALANTKRRTCNMQHLLSWCGQADLKSSLSLDSASSRAIVSFILPTETLILLTILSPLVTTAVFATCQVGILEFLAAALLSLPKQLAIIYTGVAYDESGTGNASTKKSRIISVTLIVMTVIITIASARYLHRRMQAIKGDVVYHRRKARCVSSIDR